MNRHGISQNPTAEESRLLRQLWDADDARNRANNLRAENERLLEERDRLIREIERISGETRTDGEPVECDESLDMERCIHPGCGRPEIMHGGTRSPDPRRQHPFASPTTPAATEE